MTFAVVRQLGGLGDMLGCLVVARGLKEKHGPETHVRWITCDGYFDGELVTLAEHCPAINEVVVIPYNEFTTQRTRELQPAARNSGLLNYHPTALLGVDHVIDLNNACWDGEARELSEHGRVLTSRIDLWCQAAGVDPARKVPPYEMTSEERWWGARYASDHAWGDDGRPVVLLSPASFAEPRSLTPSVAYRIFDGLAATGYRPILCGVSGNMARLAGARETLPILPLEHTFAAIAQASAMVAVDSGLLHVAGTVRTPLVGLFGPTDPSKRLTYYPRSVAVTTDIQCRPCWYAHHCCNADSPIPQYACLSGISTEDVVRAVRGILRTCPPNPPSTETLRSISV